MNMRSNIKKSLGFTLIELILVAGIFGIFAIGIIAVMSPGNQYKKANDARRKADLSQIQRSLEAYFQDNGIYPASNNYKIQDGTQIEWGASWAPYMNLLPEDPSPSRSYVYYASADGQTYVLYASLERAAEDSQACNNGSPCASLAGFGITANACGKQCNFGVSSPNITP